MAAGTSSRFVPLSAEVPKGLLEVKGEILIERQIMQLHNAGIMDITVVTGYKADMFEYLKDSFGVDIVLNEDYERFNNTSSLIRVLDRLGNTYICSSDNYFPQNVFLGDPSRSYYSALYAEGDTNEYCMTADYSDNIVSVTIGGHDSWYMIGHVYFSKEFSQAFSDIMTLEYQRDETKMGYWEDVYINHMKELPPMSIRRYKEHEIEEFDTIDELRIFDSTYISDTRSTVLKEIASRLGCDESRLDGFTKITHGGAHLMFSFNKDGVPYVFDGKDNSLKRL